jgi:hypothetical protein
MPSSKTAYEITKKPKLLKAKIIKGQKPSKELPCKPKTQF